MKISKANMGHRNTPEQTEAQSLRQFGRYVSEETKAKMSDSMKKTLALKRLNQLILN